MKRQELYTICIYDDNKTGEYTPKEVNDFKQTLSNFHGLIYDREMVGKILDMTEACVKEINKKIAPEELSVVRVKNSVLTIWFYKMRVMWIVPVELKTGVRLGVTKEGFTMTFAYGDDSFVDGPNVTIVDKSIKSKRR